MSELYTISQAQEIIGQLVAQLAAEQRAHAVTKQAFAAEQRAHVATKQELALTKRVCQELGERIAELEQGQAEVRWRQGLEKISYQRLSTPKKKILSIVRDLVGTGKGLVRIKEIVEKSDGISYVTAKRLVRELANDKLLERDYSGDGQDNLYLSLPPELARNVYHINKLIPARRDEQGQTVTGNWGGQRVKIQKPDELICPNCSSPRTNGERHETGLCYDCGRSFDEWKEFPVVPAPADTSEPVASDEAVKVSLVDYTPEIDPVQSAPESPEIPPHLRDKPCRYCGQVNWQVVVYGVNGPQFDCGTCVPVEIGVTP